MAFSPLVGPLLVGLHPICDECRAGARYPPALEKTKLRFIISGR